MEALFVSTGVVALAEIGDKTQLLAFILAARFKKPWPIIAGILCATIVNHGVAGALGAWITSAVSPGILRWALGASFIGMAIWTLIPDKIEEEETQVAKRFGVFDGTAVTGTNAPAMAESRSFVDRLHLWTRLVFRPWLIATLATDGPGAAQREA